MTEKLEPCPFCGGEAMKPTGVYCPIYGFDPPCNVYMWSLTKRG